MQTQTGKIKSYNEEKGFGFIETDDNNSLFFHISEYRPPRTPPINERVVFQLGTDNQGRTQAKQVQSEVFVQQKQAEYRQRQQQRQRRREQRQAHQESFEKGQRIKLVIACLFYLLLIGLASFQYLSWYIVIWYVFISMITFAIYAKDKNSAQNDEWRTPENTLHTLAIIGGWVGAMLAQTYLRHKSQKEEFRMVYYFTVIINLILLGAYLYFI